MNGCKNKMMIKSPNFWWKDSSDICARSLRPVSWIYQKGSIFVQNIEKKDKKRAICPVISIGNLLLGGAGKTPIVMALITLAKSCCLSPLVISRGYGGTKKGPLHVDPKIHKPEEVGEEAWLLAHHAVTFVSAKRSDALALATPFITNFSIILLDDAHQHFSLHKDKAFLVFNEDQKWGNGLVFPAGPLREPLEKGIESCNGIFYIGTRECSFPVSSKKNLQIMSVSSSFSLELPEKTPVIGFAGIGFPERFLKTLKRLEMEVREFKIFPDHHIYTQKEEKALIQLAEREKALLVTTQKDAVKLSALMQKKIKVVHQKLEFDDLSTVKKIVFGIIKEKQEIVKK